MNAEQFLIEKKFDIALKAFRRLQPHQQEMAAQGIERFVNACRSLGDEDLIDIRTILEIISDAKNDEFFAIENQRESEEVDYSAQVVRIADFFGHRIARRSGAGRME